VKQHQQIICIMGHNIDWLKELSLGSKLKEIDEFDDEWQIYDDLKPLK
jgi:hypothetical protein